MLLKNQLEEFFKDRFRTIWIQLSHGTQTICITLFPINIMEKYFFIIKYGWLKNNELNFDNIKSLIEQNE